MKQIKHMRLRAFALAMPVFYIVCGGVLLFTDVFIQLIPNYRTALGGILVGYGALRLWMWYRKRSAAEATNARPTNDVDDATGPSVNQ